MLKITITGRPEVDIQRFFGAPTRLSHLRHNIVTDQEATGDLQTLAQRHLIWWPKNGVSPERSLFDGVVPSRPNGLFIFIKTILLTLDNPTEALKATLQGSAQHWLEVPIQTLLQYPKSTNNAEFRSASYNGSVLSIERRDGCRLPGV